MKGSLRRLWVFLVLCIAVLSLSYPASALSPAQEYLLEGSYAVEQDGWTLVHLEGVPYRIGFQRGYLTAESASYLIISYLGPADDEYHRMSREIAGKYLWDRIPKEYQDELLGIAAGLRAKGYDWDVWDVLAANAWADQGLYEDAWEEDAESRCSAFIATGDATVDGQIVMGHNTWCPYNEDFMYPIIYDVKPSKGFAFRYQGAGGTIWSGQDWYVNETGLMVTETSLENDATDPEGIPVIVRIRTAVQYADSIDDFLGIMLEGNNGAYPNQWLIGDAKTGEIASLQLGLHSWDLERTFNGFLYSSNHPSGVNFREEAACEEPDPMNYCYARYVRWGQLKEEWYGKVDAEIGKIMLADHYDTYLGIEKPSARTICGHKEIETADPSERKPSGAYDGKVTTSDMVLDGMSMWARWGHPCGEPFDAEKFMEDNPQWVDENDEFAIHGLRIFDSDTPNPWTLVENF